MHKAVEDTAKAGTGGSESIANVADGGNANAGAGAGAKADKDSVTGIAKGMKAIVDAAKKAGVELKADDVAVAAGADAADAGKLFASGNNGAGVADAEGAAAKAGEAVSAVSGDQILKAIVDAAETTKGAGAGEAKNAVEAAIGDAGAEGAAGVAFGDNMKKKNQIAAAIVLRGLAKGGKFVNANAANTKVKAAVKTSEWIKEMHKAVEDTAKAGTGGSDLIANVAAGAGAGAGKKADVGSVTGIAKGMKAIVDAAKKAGVELKAADADDAANNDAGKLFANGAAGNDAGDAQGAAEKAGEAVSAVSGDQILKAIVDAAESTEGKSANTAKNAVEAAIGGGGDAAAFGDNNMKKKNQIAAAIVLRGLAKDGKFANANANANDDDGKVKAAVKTSEWIKEMHKAVEDTAKAGDGSNDELIANVAVGGGNGNGNGAGADKGSVTGIAKGMKAIVDAAGSTAGKRANTATNAVEAAIGDDGDGNAAAFGDNNMKKKNQIAAAIVLRGLAKGGKFANTNNDANGKVVAAVKHMHRATLRLL